MSGRGDDIHGRPRDPFSEMDRFVQSVFGSSSFFSSPSLFPSRNPSPTAKNIFVGGPGGERDSHRSESEAARRVLPPTITELPYRAASDHASEEEPHWTFPTSQPDTVEEPEESEVVDLVESSSYEEEDEEDEENGEGGGREEAKSRVPHRGKSGK